MNFLTSPIFLHISGQTSQFWGILGGVAAFVFPIISSIVYVIKLGINTIKSDISSSINILIQKIIQRLDDFGDSIAETNRRVGRMEERLDNLQINHKATETKVNMLVQNYKKKEEDK